jgi:hypothetical protein
LLDTGASRTCIDEGVRRALRLRAFSTQVISAPTSGAAARARRYLYKVNLLLLHPSGNPQQHLSRSAFVVAAIPLARLGTDMVLGRDLLARCRFLYDGPAGTFQLDY